MPTSICIECNRKRNLERYYRKRESGDVNFLASRMASGALQRCRGGTEKSDKHYRNRGVRVMFRSHKEFKEYIITNFSKEIEGLLKEGKTPSLDRISPKGHYEEGNIRVIDLKENARLGSQTFAIRNSKAVECVYPDGEKEIFPSIKIAHEDTGLDRATIRRSITKDVETRFGYRFHLLDRGNV